ncbi:MAG: hypothetical protein PCFJNLEI_04093 [Verrucomicrobiae bacterium]|nr:hypothetical protein [Verrucomicrobiae bacterium]
MKSLLTLFLCFSAAVALAAEKSEYEVEHPKSDLPPGGEYVAGATNSVVQYYWTNNAGKMKPNGIYASTDGGTTWKLRCWIFQFRKVFVHPETGVLYAIIDYSWLEKDKDGFLTRCSANKMLMSKDARHWKDITPRPGYVADMLDIFQDPEHGQRVCIQACGIRPYVLQPADDDYSTWETRGWDWDAKWRKK